MPELPASEVAGELWHGSPAVALGLMGARSDPDSHGLRWAHAVALGAVGRYADALAVTEAGDHHPQASLLASTRGSLLRQMGSHDLAAAADRHALDLCRDDPEALCDAVVGLAADHVGLGDADEAQRWLERVPAEVGWRGQVRRLWVCAEVALLRGDSDAALAHATGALRNARGSVAPRHVAKSLMFVAAASAPRDAAFARQAARESLAESERLGLLPLQWATHLLLDAVEPGRGHRETADRLLDRMAVGVPREIAMRWGHRAG